MKELSQYIQEKLKISSSSKISKNEEKKYSKPDSKSSKIMFDACMESENDQNIYKHYFDPLVQDLLKENPIKLDIIEKKYFWRIRQLGVKCLAKVKGMKLSSDNKELLDKYMLANILKSMVAYDHEQTQEEEDYMIEWDYYNGPHKLEW